MGRIPFLIVDVFHRYLIIVIVNSIFFLQRLCTHLSYSSLNSYRRKKKVYPQPGEFIIYLIGPKDN